MATNYSPRIATDGLVLYLDAANPKSYPSSGTVWSDLSGNGNDFTVDSGGFSFDNNFQGNFELTNGGAYIQSTITTAANATCVFWMRTTDSKSLFLSGDPGTTGSWFLGAYRSGNKEYHSRAGSPDFYMDTEDTPNIYDYIRDGEWHMIEFKNVDFASNPWPYFEFNEYSSFTFGNGNLGIIQIYNRSLTQQESLQNFRALRGRYGL